MTSEAPRKLCIAVGPSPEAQAAFRWAAATLIRPADEVFLLNVVPTSTKAEAEGGTGSEAGVVLTDLVKCEPDPRDMSASQELLQSLKEELQRDAKLEAGRVHTQPRVACVEGSNDVGRMLIQAADQCGCDAMIIGSRGLGITRRAVLNLFGLGSVSGYVVAHAPVSVIVHKQPKRAAAAAASPKE